MKSTITKSPTGHSGAESLPIVGNVSMYIETSSNYHGCDNIFVKFERTDIIKISNFTFYYNRYSKVADDFKKSMGSILIQLLVEDNTWNTLYTKPKNSQYSNSSTD